MLIVNKEADINTLGAARAVKAKVEDLQASSTPTFTFSITRDASEEIWVMFRVLGSSALFGAMLVLVILAMDDGPSDRLLVLIAIPFSSAVGLIFLFAAGIPVSNMVVFSFHSGARDGGRRGDYRRREYPSAHRSGARIP